MRLETADRPAAAIFADAQDAAAIQCERAAAELRYGRPVIVRHGAEAIVALALDTAGPATYDRFAAASRDGHELFLTGPRTARLMLDGADAGAGLLVALAGVPFEAACEIGFGPNHRIVQQTRAGTALAESAARLARLAQLLPAVACVETRADDPAFSGSLVLDAHDLASGTSAREEMFDIVARTSVPLKDVGPCEFVVFRGGLAQRDQVAIVVGKPKGDGPVPVRIHSSCITGDLFGSLKCDCGDQLRRGLQTLKAKGGGALLYLDQEGRGTGIGSKMRAYAYQATGLDTIDADAELGFGPDERRYGAAVAMLRGLGFNTVDLLTNNPLKVAYLKAAGIVVSVRTPVTGTVTAENENYLLTKQMRAGHMFDIETLIDEAG